MPLPFLYAENIFGTVSTLDTFSMLLMTTTCSFQEYYVFGQYDTVRTKRPLKPYTHNSCHLIVRLDVMVSKHISLDNAAKAS